MRAVCLTGINQISLADVPQPIPAAGEALVRIRAAALNHRDVWIKLGQYAGVTFPITPGSDGIGSVVEVGAGVDRAWVGRDVIINPSLSWGGSPAAQGAEFSILGLPRSGTLAEYVTLPATQLSGKPPHLSDQEAAALPLAGLTAYRALFTRAKLQRGERVLITGIGGGVALFALQFARAAGAETYGTSSSADKLARAEQLGALGGFNYNDPDWAKTAAKSGGFDVIIDGAGGPGFDQVVDAASGGGRIVIYGATRGNPPSIAARKIFWRQLSILGTTMGSPQDWDAMVGFVAREKIRPVISDVFPLERAVDAFALMERGGQFGKIVIELPRTG